jgi:threonine aldolase
VGTGTIANAMALATMVQPHESILCHPSAHINGAECGAPEMMTGGAKMVTIGHGPGEDDGHGRLSLECIAGSLGPPRSGRAAAARAGGVHNPPVGALSITQPTESGTCYSIDDVAAIGAMCEEKGIPLHMDGARFANAVSTLSCTPAETTWKAGVKILSFGATKNGTFGAEAVLIFDEALVEKAAFLHKRAGQLFSKGRFLSAQLLGYLQDAAWQRSAAGANAAALRLSEGLTALGAEMVHPVETNLLFVVMPRAIADALQSAGHSFGASPVGDDAVRSRICCNWRTNMADVDAFLAVAEGAAAAVAAAGGGGGGGEAVQAGGHVKASL